MLDEQSLMALCVWAVMKPMPYLTSKRFVFLTISLVAVALLLTPQHARAQGATGATYAAGTISNPAAGNTGGITTNSAFGVGAVTTGVDATAIFAVIIVAHDLG